MNFRGLLAIHATKTLTPDAQFMIETNTVFQRTLTAHLGEWENLNDIKNKLTFGAIVGAAEIIDVISFDAFKNKEDIITGNYPPREKSFGDFSAGRFGFILRHQIEFSSPIPTRGLQKFGAPKKEICRRIIEKLTCIAQSGEEVI